MDSGAVEKVPHLSIYEVQGEKGWQRLIATEEQELQYTKSAKVPI